VFTTFDIDDDDDDDDEILSLTDSDVADIVVGNASTMN